MFVNCVTVRFLNLRIGLRNSVYLHFGSSNLYNVCDDYVYLAAQQNEQFSNDANCSKESNLGMGVGMNLNSGAPSRDNAALGCL